MKRFFRKEYVQSFVSSSCINVCTEIIDSSSSRRICVLILYTSRALIIELTKTESRMKFVSERRTMKIILKDAIWIFNWKIMSKQIIKKWSIYIFNWRLISFLISRVIVICRKTECASNILETWLCSSFLISNIQESTFSSSSFAMMKKEYFICLFESCRRCFSARSWDFLSRSQIIHVLHVTCNLNFFVRFSTIA